jgi:hypothetical protein
MKRWTIGGLVAACAGLGLYLMTAKQHLPAEAPPEPPPARVAVTPPAAPVVLSEVVEVADLDPLLDPQVKPAGGAAFDPEPEVAAPAFNFAPARIPPAVD